jgi:hypothetical protein
VITPAVPRFVRVFVPVLLVLAACAVGHAAAPATPPPARQPGLEDFIAESGTTTPFMLHADLWQGIDQRVKLDSIVFVLDNGARCCQVLNRDSTWAVDYTWVYPHTLLPPRWYDARSLIHTGDSLQLAEMSDATDAELLLPFAVVAQLYAFHRSLRLGLRPDTPCASGRVNRVVKGVTIHPL